MRCRLCSRNALMLPRPHFGLAKVLRLFVRPAYCTSCHTEFLVRGPAFLGPRIPAEDQLVWSMDTPSNLGKDSRSNSVEAIANRLERQLDDDELKELAERLREQDSANNA